MDNLTVIQDTHIDFSGNANSIFAGSDTNIGIHGQGNVVFADEGNGLWLYGGANTIVGSTNDTIFDNATGLTYKIGGNAGATAIVGFGSDANGVIELQNGVGGYASPAAAAAALTSDGHGGSTLSLGSNGAIDLVGVAPGSLGASHFLIG